MTHLEIVGGLPLEFPAIPEDIILGAHLNLFTVTEIKSGNHVNLVKLENSKINARHFWKW